MKFRKQKLLGSAPVGNYKEDYIIYCPFCDARVDQLFIDDAVLENMTGLEKEISNMILNKRMWQRIKDHECNK